MDWFYAQNGRQPGPVSDSYLGLNDRERSLHDRICETRVIRTR
jgi:hypothetical protein